MITWREDADVFTPANVTVLEQTDPQITLAGEHNRRNGTLAARAAMLVRAAAAPEVKAEAIITALNTFPGTGRRFEKLADNLYTDYGHHPSEIAATLQLAHELNDRVVLVYQPHQNIRQHEVRERYTDQIFAHASEIYWLPTYLTREDPNLPVLTPEELTRQLTTDKVHIAQLDEALWHTIEQQRARGVLVLGMGAGTIDGWLREQLGRSA